MEETRAEKLEEAVKRYNDKLIVKINKTNGDDILRNAIIALENKEKASKSLKKIEKDKILDILTFLNDLLLNEAKDKYNKILVDDLRNLVIRSYEYNLPHQCDECKEIYNDGEIADYRHCFICNMKMCPSCIPTERWGNNPMHVKGLLPVCESCETTYAMHGTILKTVEETDDNKLKNPQSKVEIVSPQNDKPDVVEVDKITVEAEIHEIEDTAKKNDKGIFTTPFADPIKIDDNKKRNKIKVCGFHKKGFCKHGVKGDSCNFLHPKLCNSHINNVKCKKGEECEYNHPVICKDGVNCGRKRCRYVHTKEMKEAFTLKKIIKKSDEPNKFISNIRLDKSYSEIVNSENSKKVKKGSEKVKEKEEDFQDPKILKDTSQLMNELRDYMKTLAEKVETLILERNYYQQWNWVPQQAQTQYYQQQ